MTSSIPDLNPREGSQASSASTLGMHNDLFSGAMTFAFAIHVSPCRGAEPEISLNYTGSGCNGVFGLGFALSLPYISRNTLNGFPLYTDADVFQLSGVGDLVPTLEINGGKSSPSVSDKTTDDPGAFFIHRYRAREEGGFARIERWQRQGKPDEPDDFHWRVKTKDNHTYIYGARDAGRLISPAETGGTCRWLLEESYDACGNRTIYEYRKDHNVANPDTADRHISRICYGPYLDGTGAQQWNFELIFDYSNRARGASASFPYDPNSEMATRQDMFRDHHAGYPLLTNTLCRNVLLYHRFGDDPPFLVHGTHLKYDETPTVSLLSAIHETGYRDDRGGPEALSVPPLKLGYTKIPEYSDDCETGADKESVPDADKAGWKSTNENSFEFLSHLEGDKRDPVRSQVASFVDLYQDGLPGLLIGRGRSLHYARPLGGGSFEQPKQIGHLPITQASGESRFSLVDLDESGNHDLVEFHPDRNGYYPLHPDGTWGAFRPFEKLTTNYSDGTHHLVDVTGDGRADLVKFVGGKTIFYPSLGREGYGPALECTSLELNSNGPPIPLSSVPSPVEYVGFVDIYGDGGHHLVRVRADQIVCWAHLGNGRFAAGVELPIIGISDPTFGSRFDPARVYFADVDGTGPADLLYIQHDKVDVFINQAGNSFAVARPVILPVKYTSQTIVKFADVMGTGAQCLVLTSTDLDLNLRHWFYDFTRGTKPNLLNFTDNSMGAERRITYRPSSYYYLKDVLAGHAWRTRLSLPVQLTESVTLIDQIAETSLTKTFAYHDGCYDPVAREFRGFAYVEEWDVAHPTIDRLEHVDAISPHPGLQSDDHCGALYTRSWFHTGCNPRADLGDPSKHCISNHYKPGTADTPAFAYFTAGHDGYELSESVPVMPANMDLDESTLATAFWTLRGHLLRREIYAAADLETGPRDGGAPPVPYVTVEHNYSLHGLQPASEGHSPVCYVLPREEVSCHYERKAEDPRIEHSLVLKSDDLGHSTQACHIYYPRLLVDGDTIDEQQSAKAMGTYCSFWPAIDTQACYLAGLTKDQIQAEVTDSLPSPAKGLYAFTDIAKLMGTDIAGDPLDHVTPVTWERHFYIDSNGGDFSRTDAGMAPQGLHHHSEMAVLPIELGPDGVARYFTEELLEKHARLTAKDGYWWSCGPSTDYNLGVDSFFQSMGCTDVFGAKSSVTHDAHWLYVISAVDTAGLRHRADYDQYTLHPCQVTDENGTVHEVKYDALGTITGSSIYGTQDGQKAGDEGVADYKIPISPKLSDIISSPALVLGQVTSAHVYNLWAWSDSDQCTPPWSVEIGRTQHLHSPGLPAGTESLFPVEITYYDGFKRSIQTKQKVDAGPAIARGPDRKMTIGANNQIVEAFAKTRWAVTGSTVYDNKNRPVRQYEPFFTPDFVFESDDELRTKGESSVTRYDPLGRVICHLRADGGFSQSVYTPWGCKQYDAIDTILRSTLYSDRNKDSVAALQREVVEAAADYAETPAEIVFDVAGHAVKTVSWPTKEMPVCTRQTHDILGRCLTVTDGRGVLCMQQFYDMTGQVILKIGSDSGSSWKLRDAMGGLIHLWSNGYRLSYEHDHRHRLVSVNAANVADDGTISNVRQIEKLEYASVNKDARDLNQCGELVRHYDESGILTYGARSLTGEVLHLDRQIVAAYDCDIDWSNPIKPPAMINEHFETIEVHDAVGRVVVRRSLPREIVLNCQYNLAGHAEKLNVQPPRATTKLDVIKGVTYSANGHLCTLSLGNNAVRRFTYDKITSLLSTIETWPGAPDIAAPLQNLKYTLDPVGNIYALEDFGQQGLDDSANSKPPTITRYSYDGVYRLKTAGKGLVGDMEPTEYLESYEHDAQGNVLTHSLESPDEKWTRTNAYSAKSNRLVQTGTDRDAVTSSLQYDRGNISDIGEDTHLLWDAQNRLRASMDYKAAPTATWYVYDSKGVRVRQVTETCPSKDRRDESDEGPHEEPRKISETLYLGTHEIRINFSDDGRTVASKLETVDIQDGNRRVAFVDFLSTAEHLYEPFLRYQIGDHLGSPMMELDKDGEVISYDQFMPYGETEEAEQSEADGREQSYLFAGKERDDASGFYHYGARYYSAELGRWLSPDPAGAVDGLNLYEFVRGNPVRYSDQRGLCITDTLTPAPPKARKMSASTRADIREKQSNLRKYRRGGVSTNNPHEEKNVRQEHANTMALMDGLGGKVYREVGQYALPEDQRKKMWAFQKSVESFKENLKDESKIIQQKAGRAGKVAAAAGLFAGYNTPIGLVLKAVTMMATEYEAQMHSDYADTLLHGSPSEIHKAYAMEAQHTAKKLRSSAMDTLPDHVYGAINKAITGEVTQQEALNTIIHLAHQGLKFNTRSSRLPGKAIENYDKKFSKAIKTHAAMKALQSKNAQRTSSFLPRIPGTQQSSLPRQQNQLGINRRLR
jgi:RHS repeat-associated protein